MLERESYPPGVPCWIDIMQTDGEAARSFYGALFGWEFDDRMPADAGGHYWVAQLGGRDVAGIGEASEPVPTPAWNTYTSVRSADEAAARVRQAGGRVVTEPVDVFDAGRMAVFADPAGAVSGVWEARKHIGAQLVNEPGTWNFSELNTREPEEAARFYGAVFNWKVDDFDVGESSFTIFRLPGYGDFLEQRDPELRNRLAEDGGPEGFADAVAMLVRIRPDQDSEHVPAHWSITFAVDDADAVATRAEELGGSVVVPPFDAEPVRMTVLADHQGAVFTASKYQPSRSS
jgi:predicted enzyme related to lactoylglutathione lyase